jgi:DMSO/TMAO reductase YedYZ molybdopterin-dependent catalytic subunit
VTAFIADDPAPLPVATWSLQLAGRVAQPLTLRYADLLPATDHVAAAVDCTGGWYAGREWSGQRLGSLLDRANPLAGATAVQFHSATGYFTFLSLVEARDALLATHVGGEPLAHGHGFPLRLVAPARRGFQWVKWLDRIEVV